MYKCLRAPILAFSVFLLLPGDAAAEFSAEAFLTKYDSTTGTAKLVYLQYLYGISNGLGWANSLVGRKYPQAKFHCPPRKLALKPGQNVTILRRFIANYPKYRKAPVGAAMMFALKYKWPCR